MNKKVCTSCVFTHVKSNTENTTTVTANYARLFANELWPTKSIETKMGVNLDNARTCSYTCNLHY